MDFLNLRICLMSSAFIKCWKMVKISLNLGELCHLIDVLHKAQDCFKSVVGALDVCLRTLLLVSRRFGDLSDLFTDVDEETGEEVDGAGDPTRVAETMVKSLRRSLIFARIQEERLGNMKRKIKNCPFI